MKINCEKFILKQLKLRRKKKLNYKYPHVNFFRSFKNSIDSLSMFLWQKVTYILGGGHGNPLQCFCLENRTDKGAWRATVYGVSMSQTTGDLACMHIYIIMTE